MAYKGQWKVANKLDFDSIDLLRHKCIDNAEDFVKPMNKLLECNNNYAKASASLWKYGRDELDDDDITDSESFEFKSRLTNNTGNGGTVNVKVTVSLKYLSNFWSILEILLTNCEITLNLIQSANQIICEEGSLTTFPITDTKLYVP